MRTAARLLRGRRPFFVIEVRQIAVLTKFLRPARRAKADDRRPKRRVLAIFRYAAVPSQMRTLVDSR